MVDLQRLVLTVMIMSKKDPIPKRQLRILGWPILRATEGATDEVSRKVQQTHHHTD